MTEVRTLDTACGDSVFRVSKICELLSPSRHEISLCFVADYYAVYVFCVEYSEPVNRNWDFGIPAGCTVQLSDRTFVHPHRSTACVRVAVCTVNTRVVRSCLHAV